MSLERMLVAGIDISSYSVDVVTLPWEGDDVPRCYRLELDGGKGPDRAFRAALQVRAALASRVDWTDVHLVYVERPYSQNFGTVAALLRVQGAVLASIPDVQDRVLNEIPAQTWAKAFAGRSKATDEEIIKRAVELGYDLGEQPQDLWDALAIAWVGREENRRAVAAEVA